VTGVFPSTLREGEKFTVTGVGLADATEPGKPAEITIDGVRAIPVTIDPPVADRLTAIVAGGLVPAGVPAREPIEAKLQVSTAYGTITPEFPVQRA
jgi:hypothetical protein